MNKRKQKSIGYEKEGTKNAEWIEDGALPVGRMVEKLVSCWIDRRNLQEMRKEHRRTERTDKNNENQTLRTLQCVGFNTQLMNSTRYVVNKLSVLNEIDRPATGLYEGFHPLRYGLSLRT